MWQRQSLTLKLYYTHRHSMRKHFVVGDQKPFFWEELPINNLKEYGDILLICANMNFGSDALPLICSITKFCYLKKCNYMIFITTCTDL